MAELIKISELTKQAFEFGKRDLEADEYRDKDGLIYCKNCKTARQKKFDDGSIIPQRCDCREKIFQEIHKDDEKMELNSKITTLLEKGDLTQYTNCNFNNDNKQTPNITQLAKKYVINFEDFKKNGNGLLFWGGIGTGKTFYALCIANALIRKLHRVKFTSLIKIVGNAQKFEQAEEYFNNLLCSELIIIDDLGTERTTSFAQEQIYKFIDNCYTRKIPLIVTTNLTPKILKEATIYDKSTISNDNDKENSINKDVAYARIYSRILARCYPVKVESKSRLNETKQNYEYMKKMLE